MYNNINNNTNVWLYTILAQWYCSGTEVLCKPTGYNNKDTTRVIKRQLAAGDTNSNHVSNTMGVKKNDSLVIRSQHP